MISFVHLIETLLALVALSIFVEGLLGVYYQEVRKGMRVLYLTNIPSPYRVDFFNELGKYCDLTVLFERKYSKDREKAWLKNDFKNFKGVFLKGITLFLDSSFTLGVIKYLSRKKYDIIVIGGYSTPTGILSILTLRLMKIPFVLNSDGGFVRSEKKLKRAVKRFLISSATWWVCSGDYTKKSLVFYGAKEDCCFVYPFTSVHSDEVLKEPLSKIDKQRIRVETGITEEKVVVSVGQFIHRKGFDILIKAAKNLPDDTGVYIVGGNPTEEYIRLCEEYNVQNKVHFVPFKGKNDLKKYYMAADVFVLPTREDIWGLVVNEAMAFGLPVITTNKCIAGIELIENGKNGFIVESESVEELAQAINQVLQDETLLNKMSRENLLKIQSYTIENMAKVHFDLFKKLASKT